MSFDPYSIKVDIVDKWALEAIDPSMLKAYLVKIGGNVVKESDVASRWIVLGKQLLILEDATFADYAARMHEIIDALASLQGVSQLAVYAAVMAD